MFKLLRAIVLCTVGMVASAETYILSPPAVLDSCNEEFENVANALQPGDELILNDGVYSQACARRISINGTAENPIIIRAAEGASPLITRPESSSAQNNNIELSGSYYTIRGLRFQYGSSGVRFMGSHHITFENNKIYDTLNNALTMNSGATDSHVIRNNEIYNTGMASGSTEGEGMYIGKHSGGSEGTNHLIENNYIHHLRATSSGGNDGIEIKYQSGGNTVRGNVIHDTNIGQEFPCIFVYGHGQEPNIIENNLVYNCGEAILVTADAIIRNNIVLNSSVYGIHLRQQNPAPSIRNVTIVNNTVFGSHPVCAQLRIGSAPDIVVSNNAFYCENSTAIAGNGFNNATFSRNVVRGALSGVSIDNLQFIQGSASAQNFRDTALQDFGLLPDSMMIDAGDNTAPDMGSQDYAGNARISGAAVDVGAHEYASTSPPAPAPVPTVTLDAPASVPASDTAQLSWTSDHATECVASDGWSGSRPVSGTETTPPLVGDTQFTLTCTGPGGSASDSVLITVVVPPEPPTLTLQAPASVVQESSAQLTWSSTNATQCTASGGWTGDKDPSGSETTRPLAVDTTFTLTCSGAGGSVSDTVLIEVTAPDPDSDADGLPDIWEQQSFGNLSQTATGDPDGDGSANADEYAAGTDPTDADSDDDGLTDGQEVVHSTNPLDADTDNDGSSDSEEVQSGSDPVDSNSRPQPAPDITPPTADSGGGGASHPLMLALLASAFIVRRRRMLD